MEIKKLITEKKDAFAAQFAAEATLRRVHANQKDDNMVPIESIIAPLEADIRMYKIEVELVFLVKNMYSFGAHVLLTSFFYYTRLQCYKRIKRR